MKGSKTFLAIIVFSFVSLVLSDYLTAFDGLLFINRVIDLTSGLQEFWIKFGDFVILVSMWCLREVTDSPPIHPWKRSGKEEGK